MIHNSFPANEHNYTEDFDTQFIPLPEVVAYDTYFVGPQHGRDPYWNIDLFYQVKLEYIDINKKT